MMRNLLVSDYWLDACIYAYFDWLPPYFPILDVNNTYLNSGRLQIFVYVLSPHLTSQAPVSTSNIPFTQAQAPAAYTILPPTITSGTNDTANVIYGLNDSQRLLLRSPLYRIWWTNSEDKLTWLWFCSVDAACSMITLFII